MELQHFDLFVIGGGINGTAIALDAAGRGLKVGLCEKNDLASATSSASSKMIHGGIRYLEKYEFKLVRESLREREILLKKAPHIIWPLNFIMPDEPKIRSPLTIKLGLWLYDHLGGRKLLNKSQRVRLAEMSTANPLKMCYEKGFRYADCWVDDARLVVLNAMAAHQHGAEILVRTECISAESKNDCWEILLHDHVSGQQLTVTANALINAAGPWVNDVLAGRLNMINDSVVTLVKGSHFIVPKLYPEKHAYILQYKDNRVIFVLPYLDKYSLIGTTDIPYFDDISNVQISTVEIDYLCKVVNHYFQTPISPSDILWSYSGVRSLVKGDSTHPKDISRDYKLLLQTEHTAPLLSVLGGKITTHRPLAEHAMQLLLRHFPNMGPNWTTNAKLPGGDIPNNDYERFKKNLLKKFPALPINLLSRYARCYGTLSHNILRDVQRIEDLGECFGADLYQRELLYLMQHEWARTAEDVLWRRSKLGLRFSTEQTTYLDSVMQKIFDICISENK